jgi:hypothetical protein
MALPVHLPGLLNATDAQTPISLTPTNYSFLSGERLVAHIAVNIPANPADED